MPKGLGGLLPDALQGFRQGRADQREAQESGLKSLLVQMQMQGLTQDRDRKAKQDAMEEQYRAQLGQAPDLATMAQIAAKHGKPELAVQMFNAQEQREARRQQALENLELKRQQLQQAHEIRLGQLTTQQDRVAETARHNQVMENLARSQQALTAELRANRQPAPTMSEIVDPQDPTRMLRIDARTYAGGSLGSPGVIGVSGKEPSAQKRTEQQEGGKKQVSELLGSLNDAYNELEQAGGVISTERGALPNIASRIAASGAGQTVLGAIGTKEASLRNRVEQTRPLLMNAIRQATGMGSKQMDSNVELQFYLKAATDPTIDIQANRAALAVLDRTYGLNMGINADPQAIQALQDKAPKQERRKGSPAGGGWSIRPLP